MIFLESCNNDPFHDLLIMATNGLAMSSSDPQGAIAYRCCWQLVLYYGYVIGLFEKFETS